MTKLIASLYKYFCYKNLDQPYFRAIIFFSFIGVLFFFLLNAVLPLPHELNPFEMSKTRISNYVSGGLFLGLIYIVISMIYKKKNLDQYSFSEKELKKGARNIIFIFIFLFCLIMILAIFHVRNKLWGY